MIIGIFTDTFYPEVNGVATSCLNLYQELQRRGHTVHVYAPKCKGWEEFQSDTVHYLESKQFILLKDRNVALPGMGTIRQALDMHFDVVHTNSEFIVGFLGTYIARHTGCIRIHTYHTVWEDYTYYITHGIGDNTAKNFVKRYSEWWCDRFDRVIVPTAKTENLLRQYGVETPIDIIPSGMDLRRFAPEKHSAEERAATRAECGIPEGKRVLLNIGRLAKEKNLEKILRVFPELHRRLPDVQLVIIGEGPLKQTLQEQAETLGVADSVSIVGAKPWEKIDRYYAIGDVFVSASHSETQGLTYIEAAASGLCVCAVDDPCLLGVFRDGVSAVLSGDSDEQLLESLMLSFSPVGGRIRRNAVEAARPYSTEQFAQRVECCYMTALSERRRGLEAVVL